MSAGHPTLLLCLTAVSVTACTVDSDDPELSGTGDQTGIPTVTADAGSGSESSTSAEGTTTEETSLTSLDETTTSTTGEPCPEERTCEDECCDEGYICGDYGCELDCGDDTPCGDVCCSTAGGEICHFGQCIVPSGSCDAAACATRTEADCAEDEVCDPDLGLCLPNLADATCAFEPTPGVFDPIPRFTWGLRAERPCDDPLGCQKEEVCNADTNLCEPTWTHVSIAEDDYPEFHQVVMSPMVVDLDQDCVPEIIFNTYAESTFLEDGMLRVIRGDDGSKVWTLGDPAYRTDPGGHPAIGDINRDGTLEIIVPTADGEIMAVSATGEFLWVTTGYGVNALSGSPSIVDFDGVGNAEIAFGRAIFDAEGMLIFEPGEGSHGSGGSQVGGGGGQQDFGPLSCVADLTGDGLPELIAGASVWTFTGTVGVDFEGTLLWQGVPEDGYCGVADFNLDGTPEVVTVFEGEMTLFDGQDETVLGSFTIPGGGAGGPPNIADFDGDGRPDIGTAGGNAYVVVRYDDENLVELWQAETIDGSSQRTGSSVFDFDGDGRSEVIYGDEQFLRIYPGVEPDCPDGPNCDGIMTDDEVLYRDINSSRTRTEYPIIVDVDGDFKAEIVVSTNNESEQGATGDAGLEVLEDRLDNWVATLPIWNQHTYHVTNVATDGTIPASEAPNWSTPAESPHNSYRRNTQGELEKLCAPDLVVRDLKSGDPLLCPDLELEATVFNLGCLGVGAGVTVAFYVGDTFIGSATTPAALPAGASARVRLQVEDVVGTRPFIITAVVDDDGTGAGRLNECVEDNNTSEPLSTCRPIG